MQQSPVKTSAPRIAKPTNKRTQYRRLPKDILEDLKARFINCMEPNHKKDKIKVCFQLELAHWFYIDNIYDLKQRNDTPNIGMIEFFRIFFIECREFRKLAKNMEKVIDEWREYKNLQPTAGAILLDENMEKVLLVQSYHAKKNSWGFPKGKMNSDENARECAIRETLEETGFDFSTISMEEMKIQKLNNNSMNHFYIVKNTPKNFNFQPLTKKEIRNIQWFDINDLPSKKRKSAKHLEDYNFTKIIPFINDVRRYIEKESARRIFAKLLC